MPRMNFDLTEATQREVVDAYCHHFAYQEQVQLSDGTTGPNPEMRPQFARRMVMRDIERRVMAYRRSTAAANAPADKPGIS